MTEENSYLLTSKLWRLENLYYIKDKQGKVVKFKLNDAQLYYFLYRSTHNVIPKARQLGFTTFHIIDYLDDCLFEENAIDACIIADTDRNVKKIFEKVKLAWDHFPLKHLFTVNKDNVNQLSFSNGSSIQVSRDGRSGTFQRLHISELAKIDRKYPQKAEDIVTGAIPTVPEIGGKVSVESTGNGDSGEFYDIVKMAREIHAEGRRPFGHEFQLFFFPWTMNPEYEIEQGELQPETERYMEENNLTKRQALFWQNKRKILKLKVYQEYPTTIDECFIITDNRYFDLDMINRKIKEIRKPIEAGRFWKMWEAPKDGVDYIIGCDVAEGYGGDSSTIQVIRRDTGEQVYEYCCNSIKTTEFAKQIYKIGKFYNWALVGVERNNHGLTVLTVLNRGVLLDDTRKVYPNLYKQKSIDKSNNKTTFKLGWLTTSASKPLMLDEFDSAFEDDSVLINSAQCLIEMREFTGEDLEVKKVKSSDSGTSRHYDRLIGIAIAWQMRKEPARKSFSKSDLGL